MEEHIGRAGAASVLAVIGGFAAAWLGVVEPASAQNAEPAAGADGARNAILREEADDCMSDEAAPETVIAACTALLDSGVVSGDAKALALHRRGAAFFASGDTGQAIADLTEVIALTPAFAPAYFDRGRAFHAEGIPEAAQLDFMRAHELDPGNAEYAEWAEAYGN